MPDNEDLRKILYAGGSPDEENGITVKDIADDAFADPMRDAEGASVDPNFNITYGEEDEEFNNNLEAIFSQELQPSPEARRFLNEQIDENERFGADVVFNPDHLPVHAGIHKPTKREWTEMAEKERTKTRYNYYRTNNAAVEKVSKSMNELSNVSFGDTMRLLSSHNEEYKKLSKSPEPITEITEEFSLIQPQESAIAQTISKVEGTDEQSKGHGYKSGYDVTLEYGKFDPEWFNSKEKSLADLTVSEVIELQTDILFHPDNNLDSSAVGKWQLTRRTLKDLLDRKVIDVDLTDKFTPAVQDKIFYALLNRRGYKEFKKGELSKEDFLKGLKNEWEGLYRFRSDIGDLLETGEGIA